MKTSVVIFTHENKEPVHCRVEFEDDEAADFTHRPSGKVSVFIDRESTLDGMRSAAIGKAKEFLQEFIASHSKSSDVG